MENNNPQVKRTVSALRKMKQNGDKIVMLTAYDSSFARVADDQGVDVILVGDSLGMTMQGRETTIPVTVDDIIYHTRCVAQTAKHSLVLADLPFMGYTSPEMALHNSARLMQESYAHMVKLEGGAPQVETVKQLTFHGVPVCAHLGLQPQSVHKLGGYRVQGRDETAAQQMINDALALQDAGADMLVLECVPVSLANTITEKLDIPVIGIGAGGGCDGQVLVLQDMLGITPRAPMFSRDFMEVGGGTIQGAISAYIAGVKDGSFPAEAHCFI